MGLITQLLQSAEPSIRLQTRLGIGEVEASELSELREQVRRSTRVATLLSERRGDGTIDAHPYHAKWYGAHWVMVTLAELSYPAGDTGLVPLREQMLSWLFSRDYLDSLGSVHGLRRLHGSIEGNALWALLTLGLADERAEVLAERLRSAQWPDGGWNCDRKASGRISSFHESLLPLRALHLHSCLRADHQSGTAVEAAAELFLRRRLYRRLRDGQVIHASFVQLHYPCYWHYDILFGLAVMAEADRISDARCAEALDLVETKRLSDGGFPAEHRYYRPTQAMGARGRSLVDWGGVSHRQMNPWVSARAAVVMYAAGRSIDTSSSRS